MTDSLGIDTSPPVSRIILVRHGPTEWSRDGRHTGRTALPLEEDGKEAAVALRPRLAELGIVEAYSSPLSRALDTCRLAGFGDPVLLDDLMEWDYGEYEGRTTTEIQQERPGWSVFTDRCPGGEGPGEVARRAERVLSRIQLDPDAEGAVVLFSHGHLLRVLAVTYLDLHPRDGRLLTLDTASISVLGFERDRQVLRVWNS